MLSVFFIVVVLLGVFFTMGYIVGRNSAPVDTARKGDAYERGDAPSAMPTNKQQGPVTIADYAGKSARLGPSAFLSFLALVSISLGVLNLLPIPVLDGGHLLYYLVEAATGKAVSERWQLILQRAGLICIVALSAIALFNDLARLIHF